MTLHEAIIEAMKGNERPMNASAIAHFINETGIYIKADGKPIDAKQILLRAKNYPRWFSLNGNDISLRIDNEKILGNYFATLSDIFRRRGNTDLLEALKLFFYFRIKADSLKYLSRRDFLGSDVHYLRDKILLNELRELNDYDELRGVFDDVIYTVENAEFFEITETFNFISGINLSEESFDNYIFNSFFLSTLKKLLIRKRQHLLLPNFAANYISELIPAKSSIYVPLGEMDIFHWILNDSDKDKKREYFLQSPDQDIIDFARMLKFLLPETKLHVEKISGYFEAINLHTNVDCCFSIIPAGKKVGVQKIQTYTDSLNSQSSYESYVVGNIAHSILSGILKEAFLIVPENFLFTTKRGDFEARTQLVNSGILFSVISLPEKLFYPYSGLKTSLLILKRNHNSNGTFFIDCKELSEKNYLQFAESTIDGLQNHTNLSETVSFADSAWIAENQYSLVVNQYLNKDRELRQLISTNEYKTISQLISGSIKGKPFSSSSINSDDTQIPFVRVNNLSEETGGLKLDISSVERFVNRDVVMSDPKYIIPQNSILVATRGAALKATLNDQSRAITINNNILSMQPLVEKILPEFLLMQLKEDYLIKQLNSIRHTSLIPYFTVNDFLKLRIRVPNIEDQQRQVSEYKSKVLSQFEEVIKEKSVTSKESELKIFRAFKHELGNRSSELNNYLQTLKLYLEKIQTEKQNVDLNKKISERAGALSISDLFNAMFSVQDKISSSFRAVQNVFDFQSGLSQIKPHNLVEMTQQKIKEYKKTEANLEFVILYNNSISEFVVDCDNNQFGVLIENFIRNAEMHGAMNKKQKLIVVFAFEYVKESNEIMMHIINDGRKLPEGFTIDEFTSFGLKSGATGNTGIGGYLIRLVVDNHRGNLKLGLSDDWERLNHSRHLRGDRLLDPLFQPNVHFIIELNK